MRKIFFNSRGQVAPFMIAIIVVLIMAIMVTVNIGKVSLTKTRTANAADAGALAGSTTHANTLNTIADVNTQMIAEWLSTQVIFAIPKDISMEWTQYLSYLAFCVSQIAQFVIAWQAGIDGYEQAENGARQLAFMNGGIDEAKVRLSGESYQSYLLRDSPFGQWMDSGGYESSSVYSWTDKSGGQNSFTADVTAPDFPMLIPMPMVLFSFYYKWIPMCTPCGKIPCCNCLACNQAAADFLFRVNQANRTLFWSVGPPGVTPISVNPNTNAGVTVPPFCPCGFFYAWAWATYFVPIAFIAGISSDNPELTVTTTRIEPNKDLGIWQMRYNDPVKGTAGISSQAKSRASGGSVGPIPNPSYDSYLTSGGY